MTRFIDAAAVFNAADAGSRMYKTLEIATNAAQKMYESRCEEVKRLETRKKSTSKGYSMLITKTIYLSISVRKKGRLKW